MTKLKRVRILFSIVEFALPQTVDIAELAGEYLFAVLDLEFGFGFVTGLELVFADGHSIDEQFHVLDVVDLFHRMQGRFADGDTVSGIRFLDPWHVPFFVDVSS
jgi:hypothetical protein